MSKSAYQPPKTELAPTEAIIVCNNCRWPFNAKRETPRERFDSHRCSCCGHEHEPREIICEREYIERMDCYDPFTKPTVLYLIKAENGLVKVGIATDFDNRLSGLRSSSASSLEVLRTFEVDDARSVEQEIHERLSEYNEHGEWFDLSNRSIDGFVESVSLVVEDIS